MGGPRLGPKRAVLFDLGNTLVSYFTREEWPRVLGRAVDAAAQLLEERGLPGPRRDELERRVAAERSRRVSLEVRPLESRLPGLFSLPVDDVSEELVDAMCRAFMGPIFATGRLYDDALPTLAALRSEGLALGVVSNTPWGSPSGLWREELARLGMLGRVDAVVFCRDVGWRKPDRRPFELAMERLDVGPAECLFVGDDPRWDLAGPRAIGMDAVLVAREGPATVDATAVTSLSALPGLLGLPTAGRAAREA